MEKFFKEFYDVNGKLAFVLLCLATFLALLLKKEFLEMDTAAFEVLNAEGKLGMVKIINSLQYLAIPLFLLFKFTAITLVLWLGSFMFGIRLHFRSLFKIVMLSEFLFVIVEFLKIAWVITSGEDVNYFEIKAFYPLSYMQLFDYTEVPKHLWYVYKSINVFEIIYVGILVAFIKAVSGKRWDYSLYIVLSSYVLMFVGWLWFYSVTAV